MLSSLSRPTREERSALMNAAWRAYWLQRQGNMPVGFVINTYGKEAFLRAIRRFIARYEAASGSLPTAEAIVAYYLKTR